MGFYRKKPIVIEAFRYDGDLQASNGEYYVPSWAVDAYKERVLFFDSVELGDPPCDLFIKTLEGNMLAKVGDYIIKGVNGELYPCKPDIFDKTYEEVEE